MLKCDVQPGRAAPCLIDSGTPLPDQAAAGRMLYNTADMERGAAGDGDTAAILEGTQLCCTRQLRDLLPCLGGVAALLPLITQLGEGQRLCHLREGQDALRGRLLCDAAPMMRWTAVCVRKRRGALRELLLWVDTH